MCAAIIPDIGIADLKWISKSLARVCLVDKHIRGCPYLYEDGGVHGRVHDGISVVIELGRPVHQHGWTTNDVPANRIDILRGVILPLLRPTFLTSFISIFTSGMTAVGAVIFLISPGKNVASAELFQSIENGRYGVASVQAVFIILATVTINLTFMALLKRSEGKKKGGKPHVSGAQRAQ